MARKTDRSTLTLAQQVLEIHPDVRTTKALRVRGAQPWPLRISALGHELVQALHWHGYRTVYLVLRRPEDWDSPERFGPEFLDWISREIIHFRDGSSLLWHDEGRPKRWKANSELRGYDQIFYSRMELDMFFLADLKSRAAEAVFNALSVNRLDDPRHVELAGPAQREAFVERFSDPAFCAWISQNTEWYRDRLYRLMRCAEILGVSAWPREAYLALLTAPSQEMRDFARRMLPRL